MNIVINSILIATSFLGFCLAYYIQRSKQSGQKMVCPVRSNCEVVIRSKYSEFLGLPVETIGLFYYTIIFISYLFFLLTPLQANSLMVFLVLLSSTLAVLFSLYLTFIQIFNLKQWCIWCLASAGLCIIIFTSAIVGSDFNFVKFLAEHYSVIVIFHILGTALGLGGAIIADILFFKFSKNYSISKIEADVMHTLSQVIWCALVILIITGLGFYIVKTDQLNHSAKFLAKMVIVAVITINGILLNILVAPNLMKISFDSEAIKKSKRLHRLRRFSFALGAISMTSWLFASVLGILRKVNLEFFQILSIYIIVVLVAVIFSQLMEKYFLKKS